MNYKVAIIILNYKSWKDTLEEINTCNNILGIKSSDIIIVDNCSPNDSAENLEKKSKICGFIFIQSTENKGYGAGNNIGLRYAADNGYTHALILNNDIIIEDSDFISKLLITFKKDHKLAVVNSDIYSPSGHLFNRDSIRPTFFDYTLGLVNYKKKGRKLKDIGGYGYIYRPQGCCMLVDLKKLKEVDFFDENTFLYCEEPILAEKLLKKGHLCACNNTTSVIHNHSKTVKSTYDLNRIIAINNKSFAYYLKKYRNYSDLKIKICCIFNALKLKKLGG